MKPKKNSKADLSKRTLLFLQLGLILVLLIAYLGIEWKTYTGEDQDQELVVMQEMDEEPIPVTVFEKSPPPKVPVLPTEIEPIPDEAEEEEDEIASSESSQEDVIDIEDIEEANEEEPVEPYPFEFIEDVPVFPGCESLEDNAERKKCMSENITRVVNKRFNKDLGNKLGLSGVNRVIVLFTIDPEGNIINIQSRAPHPKLEEEAIRVIKTLPKMQPGKQRGKAVPVSFALPIVFQVQD